MKEEIIFYSDDQGVRITNARVIVGETTYSLANITSMRKVISEPWGVALILVGIVGFVGFVAFDEPFALLLALVGMFVGVVVLPIGIFWWFGQKPIYQLHLSSASGETTALDTEDKNRVEKIVQAINEAIIQRS